MLTLKNLLLPVDYSQRCLSAAESVKVLDKSYEPQVADFVLWVVPIVIE